MSEANSRRSNHDFGIVVEPVWEAGPKDDPVKLGLNAEGKLVCEPPNSHKGNARRTLEGVEDKWGIKNSAGEMRETADWGKIDPVDDAERTRNKRIGEKQGWTNSHIE